MHEKQSDYLENVPPSATGILERAFSRTGGRANAVKAKCLQCCNYVREEVRECTVLLCPLHPWRPFQRKAGTEGQPEVIENTSDDFDPDLDDDEEL